MSVVFMPSGVRNTDRYFSQQVYHLLFIPTGVSSQTFQQVGTKVERKLIKCINDPIMIAQKFEFSLRGLCFSDSKTSTHHINCRYHLIIISRFSIPVALPLRSLTVTLTGTEENPLTSNISTSICPETSVAS